LTSSPAQGSATRAVPALATPATCALACATKPPAPVSRSQSLNSTRPASYTSLDWPATLRNPSLDVGAGRIVAATNTWPGAAPRGIMNCLAACKRTAFIAAKACAGV
jgi:hypothetical protein